MMDEEFYNLPEVIEINDELKDFVLNKVAAFFLTYYDNYESYEAACLKRKDTFKFLKVKNNEHRLTSIMAVEFLSPILSKTEIIAVLSYFSNKETALLPDFIKTKLNANEE